MSDQVQASAVGADDARDAARYRWLKTRAREVGVDGGWTGRFDFYPVPAWDDTPYAERKKAHFNYRGSLDAAIDAAMAKGQPPAQGSQP